MFIYTEIVGIDTKIMTLCCLGAEKWHIVIVEVKVIYDPPGANSATWIQPDGPFRIQGHLSRIAVPLEIGNLPSYAGPPGLPVY